MVEILDLFGDPVPANWGGRGRPQHIATQENRNRVSMLLALGWNNERIAASLRITPPTLRKNYFRELRFRVEARDRLDAALAMMLWREAQGGNVAAMKEFQRLVERNDMMAGQRRFYDGQRAAGDGEAPDAKPEKLGKKEVAARDARTAGEDTEWGDDLKPPALPNLN